jgi:hypothetical protein
VVGRFYSQAVLQCRVLDGTSAEIDRASFGIQPSGPARAKPFASAY